MESELAYMAINPEGEFYFPSCTDEEKLTVEFVTYQKGLTIEELIIAGWKFTTVTVQQ